MEIVTDKAKATHTYQGAISYLYQNVPIYVRFQKKNVGPAACTCRCVFYRLEYTDL